MKSRYVMAALPIAAAAAFGYMSMGSAATNPITLEETHRKIIDGTNSNWIAEPITEEEIKQRWCLAEAIFFEAGNQHMIGKLAVADVIFNRVKSSKYPNTVCKVVHQGPLNRWWLARGVEHPIKWKCQFSYFCDGKSDNLNKFVNTITYSNVIESAIFAHRLNKGTLGKHVSFTDGATHYHSTSVNPYWNSSLERTVQIQDHIFYK